VTDASIPATTATPAPDAVGAVAVAATPAPAPETEAARTASVLPGASAVTPAAAGGTPRGSTVQVPVWLLVVVTVLVVGVGAFFVGRETAPASASPSGPTTLAEAVEMAAAGDLELGDFDARALLEALRENEDFDLGLIGDLILRELDRR